MARTRLGILAFVHPNPRRPFGEQTGYIRSLLAAGNGLGLEVLAFGPHDINRKSRRVTAYVVSPLSQRLRRVQRPCPKLVYDRFFLHLPQPATLRRYRVVRQLRWLRFLNPTFPDKWQVHQQLRKDPTVRALLPPTAVYRGSGQLLRWLTRWGRVVAKPRAGMKGRGLWFIRRSGTGYSLRSGTGGRRQFGAGALKKWAADRLDSRYLLQPELQMRDQRGRPFDIRVLVQRDGNGEQVVTGAAVRVGRVGSRVANLHRGGDALTLRAAVTGLAGLEAVAADVVGAEVDAGGLEHHDLGAALVAAVHEAALKLVRAIERRYGTFAELGIDLGIDMERKRLFFIEANSRPGRAVFRRSGDLEARGLAIRRPLQYAQFLARQE